VKEPRWLSLQSVLMYHAILLAEHGGSEGFRDEGLFHSALARPRNLFLYGDPKDVCDIAAAYGFGLAKNHPFIDGNKRVAYVAMVSFLEKNGLTVVAEQAEAVELMFGVASGEIAEKELATWLRRHKATLT
jgi:death-on-curing protein